MRTCVSWSLGVRISVCVDVRSSQMMIWLTGVSRADLTVPGLGRAERQSPLLLLPRPSWLFSNETGGQGAVTLTGAPDTWKWDADPHTGIEREDWEGPGGWRSERGEGWGGGGWPTSCQRTEWQVKEGGWAAKLLQGPLSDKRRKAHLCIHSSGCNSSVCLVSVIWQAYKDQSCSTQGLFTSQEYQQNIGYWSTFRASESLIASTKIQSALKVFLIQIPSSIIPFWF